MRFEVHPQRMQQISDTQKGAILCFWQEPTNRHGHTINLDWARYCHLMPSYKKMLELKRVKFTPECFVTFCALKMTINLRGCPEHYNLTFFCPIFGHFSLKRQPQE